MVLALARREQVVGGSGVGLLGLYSSTPPCQALPPSSGRDTFCCYSVEASGPLGSTKLGKNVKQRVSECRFSFWMRDEMMIWLCLLIITYAIWRLLCCSHSSNSEISMAKGLIYQRLEVFSWDKALEVIEANIPPSTGKSFSMFLIGHRSILLSYTIDGILYFQYFITF